MFPDGDIDKSRLSSCIEWIAGGRAFRDRGKTVARTQHVNKGIGAHGPTSTCPPASLDASNRTANKLNKTEKIIPLKEK